MTLKYIMPYAYSLLVCAKLECNVYFRISLSRNRQFCWCSLSAASRVLYVMWAVGVDMAVRYVGNCQEEELIRVQVQRLVSLPMWTCLLPVMSGYDYQAGNLTMLIFRHDLRWSSKLCQDWRNTGVLWRREMLRWMKQQGIGSQVGRHDIVGVLYARVCFRVDKERKFLSRLIQRFFSVLESVPATGQWTVRWLDLWRWGCIITFSGRVDPEKVEYCTRFIELLVDLEVAICPLLCSLKDSRLFYYCSLCCQQGDSSTQC